MSSHKNYVDDDGVIRAYEGLTAGPPCKPSPSFLDDVRPYATNEDVMKMVQKGSLLYAAREDRSGAIGDKHAAEVRGLVNNPWAGPPVSREEATAAVQRKMEQRSSLLSEARETHRVSQKEAMKIAPQYTLKEGRSPREDLLARAAGAVLKQRQHNYGKPENAFERVRNLWRAYGDGRFDTLTRADVAAMIGLMKIARIMENNLHEDSWIDLAGYAACGWEAALADKKGNDEAEKMANRFAPTGALMR